MVSITLLGRRQDVVIGVTHVDRRSLRGGKKRGPAVGKTKGSKLMAMTVSLYVNNLLINKLSYKDGRPLRRDRKGWKIERSIGWLTIFGRIATRWDRQLTIYRAFFHVV